MSHPSALTVHDFIATRREEMGERVRQRGRDRNAPRSTDAQAEHGLEVFLSQLADAFASVGSLAAPRDDALRAAAEKRMAESAEAHGRALLDKGFTVAQLVHGYRDVIQVVTEMAGEGQVTMSTADLQLFNRCLDGAIAGAVTAFGDQRERELAYQGTERLGVLAHDMRNHLNTAVLSFDLIQRGVVDPTGSTGAIHARSLSGLRALVERSLAEVRMEAGKPQLEALALSELIEEIEVLAALQARGRGLHLAVLSGDDGVFIEVDRQLLVSALSNLLQNAFQFTRPGGNVVLSTRVTATHVAIDVRDECGGLPPGREEQWFKPFSRGNSDHSGLGLGLSVARRAVRANAGEITVTDVPEHGCIFTIELPRLDAP